MLKKKNKLVFFFFCLFLALGLSSTLEAKTINFATRSVFGVGLRAGLSENANHNFAVAPQSEKASITSSYGIEPFFDFGNFVIKGGVTVHSHPLVVGSGIDPANSQNFNESNDSTTATYGLRLLLVPFIAKGLRQRVYLGFGGGYGSLYANTTRNYTSASGATTTSYLEKVRASAVYLESIIGYEFFFVQNYTLGLESSYRTLKFDQAEYASGTLTNARGTTANAGEQAVLANGTNQVFSYSGFNVSLNFNLYF